MKDMLKVVDSHRVLRVEDYQIVAIALVITKEEVLAVLRTILAPILACYLDGGCLGVLIPRVAYVMLIEPSEYFITSFHSAKIEKMQQVVAVIK